METSGNFKPTGDRTLINAKQVAKKLGISLRTVPRLVAAGRLPKPFKICERQNNWYLEDIDAAIERAAKLAREDA